MISILTLFEDMTLEQLQQSRRDLLTRRGFIGGKPVASPLPGKSSDSGSEKISAPSSTKSGVSAIPGPHKVPSPYDEKPISADEWTRKWGGAVRRATDAAIETK